MVKLNPYLMIKYFLLNVKYPGFVPRGTNTKMDRENQIYLWLNRYAKPNADAAAIIPITVVFIAPETAF